MSGVGAETWIPYYVHFLQDPLAKAIKAQAQSNFLLFSYVRSTCPPAIICLR